MCWILGVARVRPSWAYIWPLEAALEGDPVGWFAPSYKYVLEVWRDLLRPVGAIATKVNATERRIEPQRRTG